MQILEQHSFSINSYCTIILNNNNKKKTLVETFILSKLNLKKKTIFIEQIMNNFEDKKKIFCVEGNIGCGKSTILNYIKNKNFNISIYTEPIEEWTILDKYYNDPCTFSYPLQYQILLSYVNLLEKIKTDKNNIILIERCPWTCLNIFVENIKLKYDWKNYENECFLNLYNTLDFNIDTMFFLDLKPSICLDRINIRNRFYETNIDFNYLNDLNSLYVKHLKSCPFEVMIMNVENNSSVKIADLILKYISTRVNLH